VNSLIATPEFERWLEKLRDVKGKARILSRLDSAAIGNFGDCQSVGEGVTEMRIHLGQVTPCISPDAAHSFMCS